jgi:hypothetical protein
VAGLTESNRDDHDLVPALVNDALAVVGALAQEQALGTAGA